MKYVQKYILIPKEEWENINPQMKNAKHLNIPKREKNISHQKVVKSHPLQNSQVKKNIYKPVQEIVQVGKNLQKKKNVQKKKTVVKTVKQKKTLQTMKINKNLHSFIKNITSEKKDYINLIVVFLNNNKKNIKWNSKGEFYYKNEKIKNSNIGKLIEHVVSNSRSNPIGMTKFYRILASLGIPKYLVINKKGKEIIEKFLKKTDSKWRPPGKINV